MFFLTSSLGRLDNHYFIYLLNFLQELGAHIEQSLFRPSVEPVEGATVDQGGEHPATDTQSVTHWGHAQGNVELLSDTLIEGEHDVVSIEIIKISKNTQYLCA